MVAFINPALGIGVGRSTTDSYRYVPNVHVAKCCYVQQDQTCMIGSLKLSMKVDMINSPILLLVAKSNNGAALPTKVRMKYA